MDGYETPVLLVLNYATLIEDPDESESLLVPFQLMRHGCEVDSVPPQHGGRAGIRVEGEFFPFQYDGDTLYYNIEKPTTDDLQLLEQFELNSSTPP